MIGKDTAAFGSPKAQRRAAVTGINAEVPLRNILVVGWKVILLFLCENAGRAARKIDIVFARPAQPGGVGLNVADTVFDPFLTDISGVVQPLNAY